MSISQAQLNNLIVGSRPGSASLAQPPAGQAPLNGAVAVAAEQGRNAYASVSNLQKDAGFAKLFQRVNVTEENVRNFFDERLAQANARLASAAAPEVELDAQAAPADGAAEAPEVQPRFATNYADNFDFTTSDAGKLGAKLKVAEDSEDESFADKAYADLRQDLRTAVEMEDAGKSGISSFLTKFKNLFNKSEKVRFEKTKIANESGNDGLEMKVSTSSSRAQGPGAKLDTSYKKDVKDKTFWSKVGWGLLAVAGAAIAVAALGPGAILAGIVSVGWVGLGVGLVATPVLLKAASLIKAPWWGKTVEGQIQHRERAEAKALAETYATQVRAQLISDQTNGADGGPEAPADGSPSVPKRLLIDNPRKASDFLKLAHENDRDGLFEQVRKELLNKRTSHLDPTTIKHATKGITGFFKDWGFTGNQKGHANKTVDIVAEQITQGIMRGVAEGMMDLAMARCSDEMTEAARMPLWTEVKPRLDAFNEAISRFRPGNNAHGVDLQFGIHETAEPLARLKLYQSQAQSLTAQVKATLEEKESDWGANNVKAFSEGLDQLNNDIDTHVVSLEQIQKLVDGQPDDAAGAASVKSVNSALALLLTDSFDTVENVAQQGLTVKAQIDALRAELDGPGKAKLVEEHGEAFRSLLDKLEQANTALVERATTLTQVRAAFDSGAIDRDGLKLQLDNLQKLANDHAVDINPTNDSGISDSLSDANSGSQALQKQGQALMDAYGYQDEIENLQQESIQLARGGDFQSAVAQERIERLQFKLELQEQRLQIWTRSRPQSLPDLSLGAWRANVVAARLGLANPAENLKPILEKLCQADNGPVLAQLAALPSEIKQAMLSTLSEAAAQGQDTAALQAYRTLGKAFDEGQALDRRKLVSSVFPQALDALNRLVALERSVGLLGGLTDSELDQKLKQAFPDAPGDLTDRLIQALALSESDAASLACLQALQKAGQPGKLEVLLDNPQAVLALPDKPELDRLNLLLSTLLAPQLEVQGHSPAERLQAKKAAEQLQTALKPKAIVKVLAQEIAGAQVEDSKDPRLQEAVQQALQLRQPEHAQEAQALNAQIADAKKLERQIDNERGDNLEKLAANADRLLHLLGLEGKMSAEQLVNKIAQNKELANELNLLFGSLTALDGQQLPAGLRRDYTLNDRLAGAQQLSSLALWPKSQIDLIGKTDRPQAERMKQRNALIESFKGRDQARWARLLEKTSTAAKVDEYLDENLALGALMRAGGVQQPDIGSFRSLIGQAGSAQQPSANAVLQKDSLLTQQNAQRVQDELIQGLNPRLRAVQELIHESEKTFITSQSNYLVSQIPAHYEQLSGAEEILSTFKTAASPQLAAMGSKLREADTLKGLVAGGAPDQAPNLTAVKTHFLKGQLDASIDALKYLKIDKFEAKRPGFFGRFMYKMLGRGSQLNRLMQSDTRKQIGELLGLAAQQVKLEPALEQQLDLIKVTIKNAEKRQDELFTDLNKAKLAFTLLAAEHLAAKSDEGTATLEAADIEQVAKQWQDLAGDVNTDKLTSLLDQLKKDFVGKDTAAIERGLNEAQFNEVARQVGQLMAERGEIEATHRQFRAQIVEGKIQQLSAEDKKKTLLQNTIKAGLDDTDIAAVTNLDMRKVFQKGHLERWSSAMQMAATEPGRALAMASYGKFRLKECLKDAVATLNQRNEKNRGDLALAMTELSQRQTQKAQQKVNQWVTEVQRLDDEIIKVSSNAEALMLKLEDRFLRQLGEQAPASLIDPHERPQDIGKMEKTVRHLEKELSEGKSIKPEDIQLAWDQLQVMLPGYSHTLLNESKAPPSLTSIARVTDLHFRLGKLAMAAIDTVAQAEVAAMQQQNTMSKLNTLGTSILRAAEEGTLALEEGSGKWNCPPGLVERNLVMGGIKFEGRMQEINAVLNSDFEDRFLAVSDQVDDGQENAMEIALFESN
jgi:hypothetical protein